MADSDTTPFDTVQDFFRQSGWQFDKAPDVTALRAVVKTLGRERDCYVEMDEELSLVAFYVDVFLPPNADANRTMECVTRINDGLPVGAFELDLDAVEVRFKNGLDYEGTELSPGLFSRLVAGALDAVDAYEDTMIEVIGGKGSVKDLLDESE